MNKSESAYKTIGEVAKILKLQVNKNGTLPTHIKNTQTNEKCHQQPSRS